MNRWFWFSVCAILGLAMLACGLLVPAHLRAMDASILQKAGRNTPALVERGLALAADGKLGAARLLAQAAEKEGLPGSDQLASTVTNLAKQHPGWLLWGGDSQLQRLFEADSQPPSSGSEPFTDLIIRSSNRERALARLRASSRPGVQELLRVRELTNTVLFPPSRSSSGQALDAALSIGGLLMEEGDLSVDLSHNLSALATEANRGGNPQPLEQTLLDLMSLGQRFNWNQLAAFVGRIDDAETLRVLAGSVRNADGQLPALFSAEQLSDKPADLANYLVNFSQTGMNDLAASLRFGTGGVDELLRRKQRLYVSGFGERAAGFAPVSAFYGFAVNSSLRAPRFALTLKWFLYLAGGFLLAAALHFARPAVSALERPLQVRGFHVAREILFALGFLLVVLLLSEPFLAQDSQPAVLPFRLRVPTVGGAIPAGKAGIEVASMNSNLLIMLLFFVVQGLLYTACVVKLAEIRRQRVAPRMKLKLLENEEHLFDAGLYLGFLGTIVSFIIYSLYAHHQFSLMVAYSSTSFGILFVSFFKIFHLRPVRRKLLLEAEATAAAPAATAVHSFATSS